MTETDGAKAEGEYKITVRFINTPSGKDVVTSVEAGSNLLAVGDKAGVVLPRACRTGLCGSCTCEMQDPEAIATSTNPRDGFATIRACSTKCFVPNGMDEMIVDVIRMKQRVEEARNRGAGGAIGTKDGKVLVGMISNADPMARFSGDWEKEFRPQWELGTKTMTQGVGQVGGASDPRSKGKVCAKCAGVGRTTCYTCLGSGKVMINENGDMAQCSLCVGIKTTGCGYCRGTGTPIGKSGSK